MEGVTSASNGGGDIWEQWWWLTSSASHTAWAVRENCVVSSPDEQRSALVEERLERLELSSREARARAHDGEQLALAQPRERERLRVGRNLV